MQLGPPAARKQAWRVIGLVTQVRCNTGAQTRKKRSPAEGVGCGVNAQARVLALYRWQHNIMTDH